MIDQTRVKSGFDIEVLLGARYLQNLLLLATESGSIQVSGSFDSDVKVSLNAPPDLDRTYPPNEAAEQLVPRNRADAFGVDVLLGDPRGADLKITLRLDLLQVSTGLEVAGTDLQLFIRLHLDTQTAMDGGLASISIGAELVDIDGGVVGAGAGADPPVSKSEIFDSVAPYVNQTLDLTGVGGGRLETFALRKHAAVDGMQAALGIYINLRLHSGPQPDRFVGPRGDVSAALNFLPSDTDIAFAARADLYGFVGPDARYRRAEPDGDGYSYPIRKHPSDKTSDVIGQLLDITVRPPQDSDNVRPDPNAQRVPGGQQPPPPPSEGGYLTLIIHGDYQIDYFPDPDYRLYIYLFEGLDTDAIMTWDSDTDFEAGILVDIVLGVLSFALIPVLGPWTVLIFAGLEVLKEGAEKIVAAEEFDDRVKANVDATLLDVAPNRLTILRRRWDPFFETHHQLGLRPGGVQINDLGMAMTGAAALTRISKVVRGSVIRAAVRDADGALTGLTYRVAALDDFLPLSTVIAPGTDRGSFTPPGPTDDPDLFTLSVEEAARRVAADQLERDIQYYVHRIETAGNKITAFLMISLQELDDLREGLTAAHEAAARARITAEQGDAIRQQVIADFEAQGTIPTPAQIDEETTRRIEELVAGDEAAYEASAQFGHDVEAAIDATSTLVLSPNEAGKLQQAGVLRIQAYVAIHIHLSDEWYFRDRYEPAEEPTPAARMADNLLSKPRFHRTPDGRVQF
jgi:hypothetical protein